MNVTRKSAGKWAIAIAVAVASTSIPVLFGQTFPTSQPAGPATTQAAQGGRTEPEIIASLQKNVKVMRETMQGSAALTDPAKRAEAGPKLVPVLKQLMADFDDLGKVQPMAREEAVTAKQQFRIFLSLFGDKEATDQIAKLTDSKDPAESLDGKSSQLMVRWLQGSGNADAQAKVVDEITPLAKANPQSKELTIQILTMSRMGASSPALGDRLSSIVSDVMKNEVASSAQEEMQSEKKLKAVENKPVEIKGKTVDGKDFTTADWKGKVVLVDFWATWCGPCREELPRVKKIYNDYHGKGLEILAVSNDFDAAELKDFVAKDKQMPWPQLFDSAAAAGQQWNPITTGFGINGIPTMFLIDKKGVVRTVEARENMEEMIPKLLAE